MLLPWLILIPFIGGFLCWQTERFGVKVPRWIALVTMGLTLALSLQLWLQGGYSLTQSAGIPQWQSEFDMLWIPRFRISIHLAIDGLSLLMVVLTGLLGVLAVLCSWKEIEKYQGFFHLNLMWILGGVIGVFLAIDMFLFFFFWEMMLVPMYFLIALWGHKASDGKTRITAATKFFIYTQASGLVMLIAILALAFVHFNATGVWTFNYEELLKTPMSHGVELHTSQPTVSRELARFEKVLGLQLFERTRGRLQPTVQGLRLFEEVQRSWYGLDRIVSAAESLREFRQGELSIACLPVFSQSFLPLLLPPFLARYPEVSLQIVPQESPLLEEWLSAQRHDLGLTETLHTPAGTERTPLLTLNEVCVLPAGHPLAAQATLTPADFQGENYISLSRTDSYRQLLDALFLEHQVKRRMVVETHSAASICAMVRAGAGISVVNPLTALDYADSGVVVRRFSVEVPFTVSLIRPLHRPRSALVDAFVAPLQQSLPQILTPLASVLQRA